MVVGPSESTFNLSWSEAGGEDHSLLTESRQAPESSDVIRDAFIQARAVLFDEAALKNSDTLGTTTILSLSRTPGHNVYQMSRLPDGCVVLLTFGSGAIEASYLTTAWDEKTISAEDAAIKVMQVRSERRLLARWKAQPSPSASSATIPTARALKNLTRRSQLRHTSILTPHELYRRESGRRGCVLGDGRNFYHRSRSCLDSRRDKCYWWAEGAEG
ncbi:hypothetical protein FRC08_016551 [Ceratobasidium sp. 394]|nr:hypothetical protein FRC08_016551 [Ceratobasidium sp. 394]KAG9085252.1 hypothetical protein FS749_004581 [Ceratobasidium sp. UAMH 11750]